MTELQVGDKVRKVTAKGLSKYLYVVTYLGANDTTPDASYVYIQTTGGTGANLKTLTAKLVKEA
jgi:hypothetical protein